VNSQAHDNRMNPSKIVEAYSSGALGNNRRPDLAQNAKTVLEPRQITARDGVKRGQLRYYLDFSHE
jgi:hypothetical protein